jgi:hypothetical protein
LRVYISNPEDRPQIEKFGWAGAVARKSTTTWKLHLNLFQGRNLISADSNGLADPFVRVYMLGEEKFSSVCEKTLNPVINYILMFLSLGLE